MDNMQKAQKMAKIKLILEKLNSRTPEKKNLEQMALELLLAGNDKTQILQKLTLQENLDEKEQRTLQTILLTERFEMK
ncbi:hypothetical protein GCM10009119_03580 [Algoriphagus jejuensis]|uniref:Uncharacterized protein n=2 Tax=Algoriphagus jejuensis TaxID=419934 RepID=A0ABP3Y7C5_9BACT